MQRAKFELIIYYPIFTQALKEFLPIKPVLLTKLDTVCANSIL